MSIAEKLTAIAENEQKVFDAGKKAGYDAFWDNYQLNGNRQFYSGAFSGGGWHKDTFYPKYNIVSGRYSAASMFGNFNYATEYGLFDLEARLQELGITIDIINANQTTHMFQNAQISVVPELDFTKVGTIQYLCNDSKIQVFRKLKVNESTKYVNNFNNCTNLTDITFDGVIGQAGLDLHWSTSLSRASIENIINCLSTTTSGLAVTLSLAAVKKAFETSSGANNGNTSADWLALSGTKSNWTITLS